MNTFEILTCIIATLSLFFGIIAVHIKSQIDIAKLQTTLIFLQKDLDRKEVAILKVEKDNKEDHEAILKKIDELIQK